MRFRMCVGTLILVSLLTACGGRATGGFHPSGQIAADSGSPAALPSGAAATPGAPGAAGAAGAPDGAVGPGSAGPLPRTPQSALTAYRIYQWMYERAYENNDASRLHEVAMDPLLSIIKRNVAKAERQGYIWRFHNVLNPKIQGHSNDDSVVVILDCVETLGSYRYSAKTGKRLASWHDGSDLYQAVMRYTDGTYKISDATQGRKC